MNKDKLFDYLETQNKSKLFELLELAFDEMDTSQRHDVFSEIISDLPPTSVDADQLLTDIEVFFKNSINGRYYEPFNINSKNFSDIPEETNEWFEELSDYLKDSSVLTEQGVHEVAVQCFKLLYELINKMEDGEDIVFADELGSWMIPGDEKRFIKSYLTALSAVSTPEEYIKGAISLIERDVVDSFCNKVYSTATKIANEAQKTLLKKEVKNRGSEQGQGKR
jgi:hypothetical protein